MNISKVILIYLLLFFGVVGAFYFPYDIFESDESTLVIDDIKIYDRALTPEEIQEELYTTNTSHNDGTLNDKEFNDGLVYHESFEEQLLPSNLTGSEISILSEEARIVSIINSWFPILFGMMFLIVFVNALTRTISPSANRDSEDDDNEEDSDEDEIECLECLECGIEYEKEDSNATRSDRFCSRTCENESEIDPDYYNCESCDREYYVNDSNANDKISYCCRTCEKNDE